MLRIRTELKQTLMSYQELFEKSIVWGRQKMVEAEMGWERLVARREELEQQVRDMEKVKAGWVTEVNMITKHMEDLHEEQLKMQIEVGIGKKDYDFFSKFIYRRCNPTTELITN